MSPKRARPSVRGKSNRTAPPAVQSLRASDYPHVATLCRGYLHQDMLAEHGSLLGAVEAFLADLAPEDADAVASEGERLLLVIAGRTLDTIRADFTDQFRSSWHPAHVADVVSVLTRLREARRQSP